MTEIKTAIIIDSSYNNDRNQSEIRGILATLADATELPLSLVASGTDTRILKEHDDLDLVVIDYGGLSTSYGASWERAEWEVRTVCEWAREHPGKLVVLWTAFTHRIYAEGLEDDFGGLDNIAWRIHLDSWDYDAGMNALIGRMRQWYRPDSTADIDAVLEGRNE
jgi:hypothetical protein